MSEFQNMKVSITMALLMTLLLMSLMKREEKSL